MNDKKCSACAGTGWIMVDYGETCKCGKCNGTGTEPAEKVLTQQKVRLMDFDKGFKTGIEAAVKKIEALVPWDGVTFSSGTLLLQNIVKNIRDIPSPETKTAEQIRLEMLEEAITIIEICRNQPCNTCEYYILDYPGCQNTRIRSLSYRKEGVEG